jgi:hypothetical protein
LWVEAQQVCDLRNGEQFWHISAGAAGERDCRLTRDVFGSADLDVLKLAGVHPVADRLLIELEQIREFFDLQEFPVGHRLEG